MIESSSAPSAADLHATVRAGIRIHPDEPTDVMVDLEARAFAALDALLARCEAAERASEKAIRECRSLWRNWSEAIRDGANAVSRLVDRAEAAEARVAELEAALLPFGTGVEAFDRSESTYGDGPVFQRISGDAAWSFTVADARIARAALEEKP